MTAGTLWSFEPLALGCDVESVARFADKASQPAFLARVYAPDEIAYCCARANPAPHLAARLRQGSQH